MFWAASGRWDEPINQPVHGHQQGEVLLPLHFPFPSAPAPSQPLLPLAMHTNPPQAPQRADSACQPGRKLMQLKGGDFLLGE